MDRLANALSTIKNCAMSKKKAVEMPYSKNVEAVLAVLKSEGFLDDVRVFKPEGRSFKMLHVDLAFQDGTPKISSVRSISKPGRRVYKTSSTTRNILGKYGVTVVSTSQGVMRALDARKRKLGGEIICEVF